MGGLSSEAFGALLLLGGMLCIMAASYSVCYAIWSRGWEGWEAWNARTGLNEEEALGERLSNETRDRGK